MIEDLTFLEEGEFTQIDDIVRDTTEKVKGIYKERNTLWGKISLYIQNGLATHGQGENVHELRTRTVSEIIDSGYEEGCSERAIVFSAISRCLGIPTKFVDTLEKEWLESSQEEGVRGHGFVDIFVDGEWRAYEPLQGYTLNRTYTTKRGSGKIGEYVEIGKGLDFGAIYVKENGVYRPEPQKIQSTADLKEVAKIIS